MQSAGFTDHDFGLEETLSPIGSLSRRAAVPAAISLNRVCVIAGVGDSAHESIERRERVVEIPSDEQCAELSPKTVSPSPEKISMGNNEPRKRSFWAVVSFAL